jgi:hypothetical protein
MSVPESSQRLKPLWTGFMAAISLNIVQTGKASGRLRASDRDVFRADCFGGRAADAAILALLTFLYTL